LNGREVLHLMPGFEHSFDLAYALVGWLLFLFRSPPLAATFIWFILGALVARGAVSFAFFFITAPCVTFAIMLCYCERYPRLQEW
jgi:hypothetical protein